MEVVVCVRLCSRLQHQGLAEMTLRACVVFVIACCFCGRFASELSVDAFAPTVFKMEGLHAGSQYAIAFEVRVARKDT